MNLFNSTSQKPIVLEAHEGDLKHTLIVGSTARGTASIGIDDPSIEAIKALDGKIFAMLTPEETATLDFYRAQGRKYGVSITIINKADQATLAAAKSRHEADHILKSANSTIHVTCSRFYQVERQDELGQWNRMASTDNPQRALDLLTDEYRRVIDLSSGLVIDREHLTQLANEELSGDSFAQKKQ